MGVNDILDYVKHTPQNTNPNILKIMLEELAKEGDTDLQSITLTENGTYRSEEGTAWSEVEVEIRGTERPKYTQTFEGNNETVYDYGQSDPDTGFQTIVFTLEHNITELESYNLTIGVSSTPSKVEILKPNQIKFTEGYGGEYDAWPQVRLEVEYLGETQPVIPDNYLPVFVPTIVQGEEGQCTNYEELAGLENGQVLITQDGGYIDLGGTEGISYLSAVIGTKSNTTFTFKPKFIWNDGEQSAEENSRTFEINLLNGDIT